MEAEAESDWMSARHVCTKINFYDFLRIPIFIQQIAWWKMLFTSNCFVIKTELINLKVSAICRKNAHQPECH